MKIAHLSDLHLGHGHGGPGRRRAQDVLRAFEEAASRIGDEAPALVVVAGDVFDEPGVGAPAIAAFARGVEVMRERVPGIEVAVVAGLRDTPVELGRPGPLDIVSGLGGVQVATTQVRRFRVDKHGASVTLAPHGAWGAVRKGERVAEPDPDAQWNVLVGYAELAALGRGVPPAAPEFQASAWDYVALGSRHVREQVAERVHYSGSLERIGADPWREAAHEKGFLVADLESGEVEFFSLPARAVVSLASVQAGGGGPVAVARRLSEAVAGVPGGVEDKLIRVPVRGLGPDDFAAFGRDALEPLRRRTAGLRVDALSGGRTAGRSGSGRPATATTEAGGGASGAQELVELQVRGLGGPAGDLRGAQGLVGFVGGAESSWEAVAGEVRAALAAAGGKPVRGRDAPAAGRSGGRGRRRAAWAAAELPPLVAAALAASGLRRDEYAAVWFGAGPVETWMAAGAALVRGPAAGAESGSSGAGASEAGLDWTGRAPGALARWFRRLVGETERDVARLEQSQAGTAEMKARLARLREDAAEIRGDLEAAMMSWVRGRQDAETRLLLHRDRARELKEKLKEMEAAQPDGERARVLEARRDEWDSVVQDGQWWRRRRDQLEDKPAEMRAAETRKLEIDAEIDALSEEIERRGVQARELAYAQRRLQDLRAAGATLALRASPPMRAAGGDRPPAGVPERLRERIHSEAVAITGGRVASAFPDLVGEWTRGGLSSGGDVAALELATRIVLADLAVEAGAPLGAVLLPTTLCALRREDVGRALAQLAQLARRLPLVLVGAPPRVAAAAPESFDYLLWAGDGPDGPATGRMVRPRPWPARLA